LPPLNHGKNQDILGEAGNDLPIIRILPNIPAMIGED
jgi:pyrroline-5-carboxylate reductase